MKSRVDPLHGSTCTWDFFNKCILRYYTIHGWLNPRMCNRGYKGPTVKLYVDLWLHGGSAPLTPVLIKSQLYMATVTLILLAKIEAFLNPLSPDFVMHILAIVSSFMWSKNLICIPSISLSKLLIKCQKWQSSTVSHRIIISRLKPLT